MSPLRKHSLPTWLVAIALACGYAQAQEQPEPDRSIPIGQRYIDTLPKSSYPIPVDRDLFGQGEQATGEYFIEAFPKPSFRVGERCLERLCVIEAHGPTMHPGPMDIVLRDETGAELWRERAWWLRGNQQMRAYWLPVSAAGGDRFEVVQFGEVQASRESRVTEDAIGGLFEVTAQPEPLAVDEGFGLLPTWHTLVEEGGQLRIGFAVPVGEQRDIVVRGRLDRTRGGTHAVLQETFATENVGCVGRFSIPCGKLRRGEYVLHLSAASADRVIAEHKQQVHIRLGRRTPRFGARYTSLSHPAPVYVNLAETVPWADLWRGMKQHDVVVDFPGQPYRFVFWRGTSYVPCWAFPNAWLTYEWLEAEPDYYGAVGCVEPIMDKHCRYSRVRIVESSPARVVVHWRYALTDLHCKIIKDEWADEYFYLYPDAIGTRKLVAWISGWAWHENQEFIILNRPGAQPWQAVQPQAVTFMSTAGDTARPVWPCPRFSVGSWPDCIARVNMRDQPNPFQATADDSTQIKVWAEPYLDKPGLFNCYLHWPISHGIRTTWLEDPADFHRPTHSNLVNIVSDPEVREEDYRIWAWLIGIAPGNARLREVVKCWLHPGEVSIEGKGVSFRGYDRMQRAYLVRASASTRACRLTIVPEEGAPIINPALVIEGWDGDARVTVPGRRVAVMTGRERDGKDLVVWLRGRFEEPVTLWLSPCRGAGSQPAGRLEACPTGSSSELSFTWPQR